MFRLIVNDGTQSSAADTTQVTTINSAPVARAGSDQTVHLGQQVTLDGSESTDVDGDALTYHWSIVTAPGRSTAAIDDPNAVKPTLRPDLQGDYQIQLEVDDGTNTSAPDTMLVSTTNSRPVANAGPDQTVQLGAVVVLDGAASNNPDGDALSYRWSLVSLPTASTATLQGAKSANPTLVADKPGTYVVQLIVNDGTTDGEPDTVVLSTANSRPLAVAGANQSVHWG